MRFGLGPQEWIGSMRALPGWTRLHKSPYIPEMDDRSLSRYILRHTQETVILFAGDCDFLVRPSDASRTDRSGEAVTQQQPRICSRGDRSPAKHGIRLQYEGLRAPGRR